MILNDMMMLVVKFGLSCEVLQFVWKTNNNCDTWWVDDLKHMFYLIKLLLWIWIFWCFEKWFWVELDWRKTDF